MKEVFDSIEVTEIKGIIKTLKQNIEDNYQKLMDFDYTINTEMCDSDLYEAESHMEILKQANSVSKQLLTFLEMKLKGDK